MRKKFIFSILIVLILSLGLTYIFGVRAQNVIHAENVVNPESIKPSEGSTMPEVEPTAVSADAIPIRNLWGASAQEKVDLTLSHSDNVVSWSWNRQHPVPQPGINYVQPIYPNARIVLKSPVTVGDIQSFNLVADFHYTQPPTGDYNLAYDIFLKEEGAKTPKAEIMVCLDRTKTQPQTSFKGFYSDGDNTYSKYYWTREDSCSFRSFRLSLPPTTTPYQVNLKSLIDLINPEKTWYISEVELGTEVWSGSGAVELTTYYLELNGTRL